MKTKTLPSLLSAATSYRVISCLLLILPGIASAATFYSEANASSGTTQIPGPSDNKSQSSTAAPTSTSAASTQSESSVSGGASANASATTSSSSYATVGGLHLVASSASQQVNTPNAGLSALGSSSAKGRFTDSFVVAAGSCAAPALCAGGQSGTITVAFNVHGSTGGGVTVVNGDPGGNQDQSGSGLAEVFASLQLGANALNNTSVGNAYKDVSQNFNARASGGSTTGNAFGTYLLTLNIQFGGVNSLNMYGVVDASSGAGYNSFGSSTYSTFSADLGNTIAWGGILDVRDANGNLITDFTAFSSDTRFNYANAYVDAVPVPAAAWLFGSGLLGLTGFTRKRKVAL